MKATGVYHVPAFVVAADPVADLGVVEIVAAAMLAASLPVNWDLP